MVLCPYWVNIRRWISKGFTPSATLFFDGAILQRRVHVFALVASTRLKAERCTARGWTLQQALSITRNAPAPLCSSLSRLPRNLNIAFSFWFTLVYIYVYIYIYIYIYISHLLYTHIKGMRGEDMEQSNCCLILKRHYVKINGRAIRCTKPQQYSL